MPLPRSLPDAMGIAKGAIRDEIEDRVTPETNTEKAIGSAASALQTGVKFALDPSVTTASAAMGAAQVGVESALGAVLVGRAAVTERERARSSTRVEVVADKHRHVGCCGCGA